MSAEAASMQANFAKKIKNQQSVPIQAQVKKQQPPQQQPKPQPHQARAPSGSQIRRTSSQIMKSQQPHPQHIQQQLQQTQAQQQTSSQTQYQHQMQQQQQQQLHNQQLQRQQQQQQYAVSSAQPPTTTTPATKPISSKPTPQPKSYEAKLAGHAGTAHMAPLVGQRLNDMLRSLDPNYSLDQQAEEEILRLAQHFLDNVVSKSIRMSQHRGSKTLDVQDVQFILAKQWGIVVPGLGPSTRPANRVAAVPKRKAEVSPGPVGQGATPVPKKAKVGL